MTSALSADEPIISPSIVRNLTDKLYERRKLGALEIEHIVKDLKKADDREKLSSLLSALSTDFINSSSQNSRKGGLIAIAAAALGLGASVGDYVDRIVPPVLTCFDDPDHKVRYYACEALFNITKVSRGHTLKYFPSIFDCLCKLSADPDKTVKDGAELLDRLIKDVISEGHRLDVTKLIPLIAARITWMVTWIRFLDTVPDVDLVEALPHFLDGLFRMLSDRVEEIRQSVLGCLANFLSEIEQAEADWVRIRKEHPNYADLTDGSASGIVPTGAPSLTTISVVRPPIVHYGAMLRIALAHCRSKDEVTAFTALQWCTTFLKISGTRLLPYCAKLLDVVLPQLSHSAAHISNVARLVNVALKELVAQAQNNLPVKELLESIAREMESEYVLTRKAALKWILVLNSQTPELQEQLEQIYTPLLNMLNDVAEVVVRLDLQVLAKLSATEVYFEKLMGSLVSLFRSNKVLLEGRATLIVRQICLHIPPERVYRNLARNLEDEEDLVFASTLIQTLNLMLLTAPELSELKQQLRALETDSGLSLFNALYKSWCHNEAAVFSLCLLAQEYQHSSSLIFAFAQFDITVNGLLEIDKLIQLLESPIFMSLRLQLLEPQRYPYLIKALYGLLMLLPQGSAFNTLRRRLGTVSQVPLLQQLPSHSPPADSDAHSRVDYDAMLAYFILVRSNHAKHLLNIRLEEEKKASNSQILGSTPPTSSQFSRSNRS